MGATASAPTTATLPGAFPSPREEDVLRQLAYFDSIFSPTLSVLPVEDVTQPPFVQPGARQGKDAPNETTLEQSAKEGEDATAATSKEQRGELPSQTALPADGEETGLEAVAELPPTETSTSSENDRTAPPPPSESTAAPLAEHDDDEENDEAPSPPSVAAPPFPRLHPQVDRDNHLLLLPDANSVGTDGKEVGRMGRWKRLWGILRGRRAGRRNGGGGRGGGEGEDEEEA